MKNYRLFALTTAASLGLMISSAHADGGGFTSHHTVPAEDYSGYAHRLDSDEKYQLREYLDYEDREPCQGYQKTPQPFVDDGCGLNVTKQPEQKVVAKKVVTRTMELRPIISDYTVYFDFDDSSIRASENSTLDTASREIKEYNPYEVTIEGHTDRSGPADYNAILSQKRAKAVSKALTARGIPNRILGQQAKGEADPAVPTEDGVKLQENRRVEIQFRK